MDEFVKTFIDEHMITVEGTAEPFDELHKVLNPLLEEAGFKNVTQWQLMKAFVRCGARINSWQPDVHVDNMISRPFFENMVREREEERLKEEQKKNKKKRTCKKSTPRGKPPSEHEEERCERITTEE